MADETKALYRIEPDPHKIVGFVRIYGPGMAGEYLDHKEVRLHPEEDELNRHAEQLARILYCAYEAGKRARSHELHKLIFDKALW